MARTRTSRQAPGQEMPSLGLECEPSQPSASSPEPRAAFVNSRQSFVHERVQLSDGSTLILEFDNLAREYQMIGLTPPDSIIGQFEKIDGDTVLVVARGKWPGREHLYPALKALGLVPTGWERVYSSVS